MTWKLGDPIDMGKVPAKEDARHRIIIVMEGGVIQDICNIPPDVIIEVRDFDTEDSDPTDPGIRETEEGETYFLGEWEAQP